jgi:hypothetical protein
MMPMMIFLLQAQGDEINDALVKATVWADLPDGSLADNRLQLIEGS